METTAKNQERRRKRELPDSGQYPIYLKRNNIGKIDPNVINTCLYKITSPSCFMHIGIVNHSVDIRLRGYKEGQYSNVFDEYMAGSAEYSVIAVEEFESLMLDVNKLVNDYARS